MGTNHIHGFGCQLGEAESNTWFTPQQDDGRNEGIPTPHLAYMTRHSNSDRQLYFFLSVSRFCCVLTIKKPALSQQFFWARTGVIAPKDYLEIIKLADSENCECEMGAKIVEYRVLSCSTPRM